jgi:hypothetical protein
MQVERDPQFGGGIQDGREVGVIEEPVAGHAVNHGSEEAEFADCIVEFGCRGVGIGQR